MKMKLNRLFKMVFCLIKFFGLISFFKYKRYIEKKNIGELFVKYSKYRVLIIYEQIMLKFGEGLCFGQKVLKNFDKMFVYMGN